MTSPWSKGPLALLLLGMLGSCALTLDFDELQKGGEPSGGSSGSGATPEGGEGGVLAAGATGTDGGAGAGGDPGIAIEGAAAALAETLCAKLEACFGAAALEVLIPQEECAVAIETSLASTMVANIQQSVQNGTLEYDGSAMPGCLEAYAALACEDVTIAFPEECKQTLGGLLPEGEPCTHALECDAGLYCSSGACPGTCSVPLQEDDPCTELDVCAAGLTCFQEVCAPLGGEGDDCGGDVLPGCVTGFVCLGADAAAMMPGECYSATDVFVLSEGQPCSLNPPALCDVGASCPIAFGAQCLAEAESEGACQAAVPDMCPDDEYCNAGTCAALPAANEACRFSLNPLDPRCQAYLRCVNNVCRPLGEIGDPCGVAAECHSGACDDGECVPPACR